jgi:hypothetical protein
MQNNIIIELNEREAIHKIQNGGVLLVLQEVIQV